MKLELISNNTAIRITSTLFANNNTKTYTISVNDAAPGWYIAFKSFESLDDRYPIFQYSSPISVSINLTEVCFSDYSFAFNNQVFY